MVIIAVGNLDLGNNYSYGHFVQALSDTQIERILNRPWELDSEIKVIGAGNYGKVSLTTCGSDLADHLRQ